MRLNYDDDNRVEVQVSPLIDCVFLLLISFLATTMMKKWEMQTPLTLLTMTSGPSTTRAGKETAIIAVDERKNVCQVIRHNACSGESAYLPIENLSAFLSELRNNRGAETNIDAVTYRTIPANTVIEILDQCQIQGSTHTRARFGSKPY